MLTQNYVKVNIFVAINVLHILKKRNLLSLFNIKPEFYTVLFVDYTVFLLVQVLNGAYNWKTETEPAFASGVSLVGSVKASPDVFNVCAWNWLARIINADSVGVLDISAGNYKLTVKVNVAESVWKIVVEYWGE